MESRYDSDAAARMVEELAPRAVELLAQRTYTARLVGADPCLVLHGGGNTSVKATATSMLGDTTEVIRVKGSGFNLATIEPEQQPAVRLEPLRRLRALSTLSDAAMVNELRANLLDASAPSPSIETLLHAFLPARFVDHTHADAILALCDQPDGERAFTALFGNAVVWVPYVMPGFALAKRCIDIFELVAAREEPAVMVLERHGLFTWGGTAKESYERTIDAVSRAERYIATRGRTSIVAAPARVAASDAQVVPRLRGALARLAGDPHERGPIVRTRATPSVLAFLERRDAAELVNKGCATPDHVRRTKPSALFIPTPALSEGGKLTSQLERAIADYARKYDAYFEQMCRTKGVERKKLEPWPRIVLLPGFGACSVGATAHDADVALDIYEHTIDVMTNAAAVGAYAPCTRSDLFDVEYWGVDQSKVEPPPAGSLVKCVGLVTGAASGIGLATSSRMLSEGAHVAMVDKDFDALAAAIGRLPAHKDRVLMIAADVRDEEQVSAAFARAAAFWGGVDLVVSSAGSAPEGQLDTAQGQAMLRYSIELNCLAHAHVVRAAVEVMVAQGHGGCLCFNASQSALTTRPGFGPYAVAKSALLALMRQYAVDLGPHQIRSNAVNADRVRTQLFAEAALESRAKAQGLSVDEYFRDNLLSREVTADDIADAFVYLGTARATTGCIITLDGGNAAAFPR
jgi:rhamnose utilization protein RhaD (predicted bifunctional aldolase and dehydrogenase)/NAD(P)-dependent dehydrogenase (short-subunit alcohol dehydrogenase family)